MFGDPRLALEAIGLLPDTEIDIADAAIQLARVDAPDSDWRAARARLSELARDVVARAAQVSELDRQPDLAARARVLATVIAGEHGYHGDDENYDDPDNANLIRVIERRKGLPVALGILWLHGVRAAGWSAHGCDFPGHFVVALEGTSKQLVVDAFGGGRVLDARQLRALVKRVQGESAELTPGLLQPMNTRSVLLRLQNNIKFRRLQSGDIPAALIAAEDMLRIAPDHAGLWREAAVMHQRLDHVGAALRCFERYLELVPRGDTALRARAAINELRTRLN